METVYLSGMKKEKTDAGSGLYPVVEMFYTLQGEGLHSGMPAFFIRLAGCGVGCEWCDSKNSWNRADFPLVPVEDIVGKAVASGTRAVVITGGEPMLHNLDALCGALKSAGLSIFLETSGSERPSGEFDWICLSPKVKKPPLDEVLAMADELKVVVGCEADFSWAEANAAKVGKGCALLIQPEWSRMREVMPQIVGYVKANPQWRVSLQTHKFMDIP